MRFKTPTTEARGENQRKIRDGVKRRVRRINRSRGGGGGAGGRTQQRTRGHTGVYECLRWDTSSLSLIIPVFCSLLLKHPTRIKCVYYPADRGHTSTTYYTVVLYVYYFTLYCIHLRGKYYCNCTNVFMQYLYNSVFIVCFCDIV